MLTVAAALAFLCAAAAPLFLAAARATSRTASASEPLMTERSEAVYAPTDEVTATHEAGHVILAWASPFVTGVTGVVLDEGGESGVTTMVRGAINGEARLWDAIAISLAGIAAEGYAFGRFSTRGCQGDLKKARNWADELASLTADDVPTMPWRPSTSRSTIDVGLMFELRPDERTCAAMNAAYRHAKSVIAMRPAAFRTLAHAIRTRGRLSADDLTAILGPRPWAILAPKK